MKEITAEGIMLQFLLTISDESNHGKIEYIYKKYHKYFMKCAIERFKDAGRSDYHYYAEEAVQNTFIRIVRYIGCIDFSRGDRDVKNYCLTILSNEINNIFREKEIFSEIFEKNEEFCVNEEYNFIEKLEMQENYAKLVKAIEELDDKYSATLRLYVCNEMQPCEIADFMGVSVKTVYTRLARGRELLLDSLKGVKIDE